MSAEIIIHLKNKFNVKINSAPGSGKTTSILSTCSQLESTEKILVLMYNKSLELETKSRVRDDPLLAEKNIDIYTFHSFGFNVFEEKRCITDEGLYAILNTNVNKILEYSLIFIDECQDMTPLLYNFSLKIMGCIKNDYLICLLGDKNQAIYDFKGSNKNYLIEGEKYFNNNHEWKNITMNKTYRLTKNIADFVNNASNSNIISLKELGQEVRVVSVNYRQNSHVKKILKQVLENYSPSDVLIVSPSLRSMSLKNVCNNLGSSMSHFPISFSVPEKDKVFVTTYNSSKGMERKVVLVLDYDFSYFEFFAKDAERGVCTNSLYVALTRASEKLIVVQNSYNDPIFSPKSLNKKKDKNDSPNSSYVKYTRDYISYNLEKSKGILERITVTREEDLNVFCAFFDFCDGNSEIKNKSYFLLFLLEYFHTNFYSELTKQRKSKILSLLRTMFSKMYEFGYETDQVTNLMQKMENCEPISVLDVYKLSCYFKAVNSGYFMNLNFDEDEGNQDLFSDLLFSREECKEDVAKLASEASSFTGEMQDENLEFDKVFTEREIPAEEAEIYRTDFMITAKDLSFAIVFLEDTNESYFVKMALSHYITDINTYFLCNISSRSIIKLEFGEKFVRADFKN